MELREIIEEIVTKNGPDYDMLITKEHLIPYYYYLINCSHFNGCEVELSNFKEEPNFKTIKMGDDTRFTGRVVINSFKLTPPIYDVNKLFNEKPKNDAIITPAFYDPINFIPYKKIVLWFNPESKQPFDDEKFKKSLINKFVNVLNNPEDYKAPKQYGLLMNGDYRGPKNTESVLKI